VIAKAATDAYKELMDRAQQRNLQGDQVFVGHQHVGPVTGITYSAPAGHTMTYSAAALVGGGARN